MLDSKNAAELIENEDNTFSFIDIIRLLVLFALISGVISYFITGESFIWNVPAYTWKRPVAHMKLWLVIKL